MNSLARLRADPRVERLASTLVTRRCVELPATDARRAAVAALIRLGEGGEPELYFIQRATYEGDPWSGQIAFPGGRSEPQDPDILTTAVRETREETGFDLQKDATLLGRLDDFRPRAVQLPPIVVSPFVFLMPEPPEPVLSSEVADSFWVPLSVLADRSVWRNTTVSAGGIELSRFAFHHQGFVVWGMTERILTGLLALLTPR